MKKNVHNNHRFSMVQFNTNTMSYANENMMSRNFVKLCDTAM